MGVLGRQSRPKTPYIYVPPSWEGGIKGGWNLISRGYLGNEKCQVSGIDKIE
jgi:hypothetical protein